MKDIEQLSEQNHRMFIVVRLNFVMLAVLFVGLGIVIWQSATLISDLKSDLARAEEAVAKVREQIQKLDAESLIRRVMAGAKEELGDSIKSAVSQSDFGSSLGRLAENVENTQAKIDRVGEALRETHDRLQTIDTEKLAQLIAYNILEGLGEGFTKAAQANKPDLEPHDADTGSTAQ